MPFRKRAIFTLENRDDVPIILYYQINYALTEVPADCAYFHAQFRRTNPVRYLDDYTIVDDIRGRGHYVGTYMAWGVNSNGWWGEGEIKFFMDSDKNIQLSAGLEPKITFVDPMILILALMNHRIIQGPTLSSRPPMRDCLKLFAPTEPTALRNVLACTAGTSLTLFGSKRSSESLCKT